MRIDRLETLRSIKEEDGGGVPLLRHREEHALFEKMPPMVARLDSSF